MNEIIKHSLRFVLLTIIQAFVLNQLEIGLGIQLLIYPLFVFLLPFELGLIPMLVLSFTMGIMIDSISNTYGLHASSLTLFAYLRPMIFKTFSPREGYDVLKEPNIFEMGNRWFIYTFGILLFIHHFWFFLLEMFRIDAIFFILQKTLLSLPISFAFCILIQMLVVNKPKSR